MFLSCSKFQLNICGFIYATILRVLGGIELAQALLLPFKTQMKVPKRSVINGNFEILTNGISYMSRTGDSFVPSRYIWSSLERFLAVTRREEGDTDI